MAAVKCKVNFYGYQGTKVDKELIQCVKILRKHTDLQLHPARDLVRAATKPNTSATVSIGSLKGANALAKELRAQGLTVAVERV